MPETWIVTIFGILLTANFAQTAIIVNLSKKVGALEKAVKNACPWGNCPSFEQAKRERSTPGDHHG
ncbi:MAG: hypothetical protein PHU23_00195 [Dehalococcoidales bacterium]|nr:hypothetical protein [Dehalococcoidales bacterium]